ncbi:MAG TPA: alpha/beta hydrolase [Acidimicrobiales bacterium]|nr:alpha/beta hydrolase [Acidimicrobiales bacterium]
MSPPIVFVHGGLLDESMWDGVVAALDGFDCTCIRRRTRHDNPDWAAYSYEAEYEDVARVLDEVGPPRFLVGYSSGAIVALGAAWHFGVDRLALFEPPLPVKGPVLGPHLAEAERLLAAGDVAGAVRVGLVEGVRVPPEVADRMVADPRVVAAGEAWVHEFAEIDGLPADIGRYASVECPVLLLETSETQQHHRDAVHALAGVLPDNEVVTLQGLDHGAARTAPARLAAELRRFFAG